MNEEKISKISQMYGWDLSKGDYVSGTREYNNQQEKLIRGKSIRINIIKILSATSIIALFMLIFRLTSRG